jgi:membrane-associated phospholipid phosphatase
MKLNADATRAPSLRRVLVFLILAVVGIVGAHVLDPVVYRHVHYPQAPDSELLKMFRGAGYLPLWGVLAAALILIDTAKRPTLGLPGVLQRGLPIILSVVLGGAMTEGAKSTIHRCRPPAEGWDGHYQFRPYDNHWFNNENLGMASSHAGVAFGAVWMLVRMYPRGTLIWMLIGLGCAWERLLEHAHFFSDVTVAMIASYAAAWLVWHCWKNWVGFQNPAAVPLAENRGQASVVRGQ